MYTTHLPACPRPQAESHFHGRKHLVVPDPHKNQVTLYLAGPMTGFPQYNFPMFDKGKAALKAMGYKVISPADLDREDGFIAENCPTGTEECLDNRLLLLRDVEALVKCDGVALLPGWENSRGVRMELACAAFIGIPVLHVFNHGDLD